MRYISAQQAAELQAAAAVEMILVGEEIRPLEREVRRGGKQRRPGVARDVRQRAAGHVGGVAVGRARWDAHEDNRHTGRAVFGRDRAEPLAAILRVRRAGLGDRQHLRRDRLTLIVGHARRIRDRVRREVHAQTRERFAARMPSQRIVRRHRRRPRQHRQPRRRIGREGLEVVAQLHRPPEQINAVFHAFARVRERAGQLRQIAHARLEHDVPQVHRPIVAVEAADGAVVVAVGVDRNHDGAKAIDLRIDRAHEERPAARRRARHAPVEKAQRLACGARRARVQPGVDARIAEHQHVGPAVAVQRPKLIDRRLEAARARVRIEQIAVEVRAKRREINDRKNGEGDRGDRPRAQTATLWSGDRQAMPADRSAPHAGNNAAAATHGAA